MSGARNQTPRVMAVVAGIFVLLFLVFSGNSRAVPVNADPQALQERLQIANETGKVAVDFFVMSKCPDAAYCEKYYNDAIHKLAPIIDVKINYIASKSGSSFACMHGSAECTGNMQQLCVQKHYPENLAFFDFAVCESKSYSSIPSNGEDCANALSMDFKSIDECVNNGEGASLLEESIKITQAAGVRSSCTVNVDNTLFCIHDGVWRSCSRGSSPESLIQVVCEAYKGSSNICTGL
eukprot:Colp12_sorted_trinity150504_noHs@10499